MKRFTLVLTIIFIFSCINFVFATGIQNENGQPYAEDQLGYWGTDSYIYNESPFENLHAPDKGLIPYQKENQYNNPNWWAISEILEASKMGLNNMNTITGYQNNITRSEFCKLIMQSWHKYSEQSIKKLPSSMPNYFDDITLPEDEAIVEAYYLGIVQGRSTDTFDPNTYIPREELALMLLRYIALIEADVIGQNDVVSRFSDTNQISIWARKECIVLGNLEIFLGDNYNKFMPKEKTTKEQSLLLILRVAKRFVDNQVENNLIAPTIAYNQNTKVTWNAIASATNYRVAIYQYLSKTEKGKTKYEFTNTTSLDLKNKLKSGTYEITVMSLNEFNNSVESEPVVIHVPESTENVTLSGNDLSFDVSSYKLTDWTNSSDNIKYKVEVVRNGEVINTFDNITTNSLSFPDGTIEINDTINVYAKWNGFTSAATTITVAAETEVEEGI
jgi:hypothetical protein